MKNQETGTRLTFPLPDDVDPYDTDDIAEWAGHYHPEFELFRLFEGPKVDTNDLDAIIQLSESA